MKVVYLSDQRYYYDESGRWYTTASFPLPALTKAFPPELTNWVFFGRLQPAPSDVSWLFPIVSPPGISVEFRGPRTLFRGTYGFLKSLPQYYGMVRKSIQGADIIWAKLSFVASLMALLGRAGKGYFVTHLVGDPGDTIEMRGGILWGAAARMSRSLNSRAMANADVCLFVSNTLLRRYAPRGKKAVVVHEGRICRSDLAERFKVKEGGIPIILYVGRLSPEKGVDILVHAVNIARRTADLRLRLVGSGGQKEKLRSLVASLGLTDFVTFVGPVRWGTPLFSEIRSATCLVLPSYSEGCPLVVLEGLSQATPVISSDVGGVGEFIESGKSGLLVPSGDPNSLSKAILRMVSDPELQARLANEGLRVAVENTLECQVERLRSVFVMAGQESG